MRGFTFRSAPSRYLFCGLFGERLETRLLLAGVEFVETPPFSLAGPPGTAENPFGVYAADADGDGDLDLFTAIFGCCPGVSTIAWYQNTDGQGSFGPQEVISVEANGHWSVYAADLDGDGDVDVLSASARDGMIAWYENTDGLGGFTSELVISTASSLSRSVYATDIDGDGDVDVLSAGYNKIAWYENTDGRATFGPQQVITTNAEWGRSVYAADLDGDGDVDVLSASMRDNKVAWYENIDGAGTFGPQQVITINADTASSVYAADLDSDGDLDVLSASILDNKVAWYENIDGAGTFGPQQVITRNAEGARSVYAADVDGDGDVDVLSASSGDPSLGGNKVAWYENIDGAGTFGPQQVIATAPNLTWSVYAADVDGDGDVDVLATSLMDGKPTWYKNVGGVRQPGDANEDRQFDQMDILQVLQAGKYLTGESAGFAEGDWNADGVFDQLDIVVALQTGSYLQGANIAATDMLMAEVG